MTQPECNAYRVDGPPGVGKTTWLKGQVTRAVEKHGENGVMVLSFTRAAAQEVVSRGVPCAEHNVGTLHAICYRAMGNPTLAESKLKEWNETHPEHTLEGGVVDVEDSTVEARSAASSADDHMSRIQILRGKQTPVDLWPLDVMPLWEKWQHWKRVNGYTDFTDLIETGLRDFAWAPGRPPVIFVDEAQDLTPLELAVVRSWGKEADRFILVGDALQALYGFRGASPHAFLEPELPPDHVIKLRQSYRVPRAVHAKAVQWASKVSYGFSADYQPRDDDGELVSMPDATTGYSRKALDAVERDVTAGKRVMILAGCGYMLGPIIKELKERGLPFHNPYASKRGDWNQMRGGAARLSAYFGGFPDRVWTVGELRKWTEMLAASGLFLHGGKKGLAAELKKRPADELLSANRLREFFDENVLAEMGELLMTDRKAAVTWLKGRMLESWQTKLRFAFEIMDRRGAEALTETPKVVVGTVHSVKGGEADSVYLFPDLSNGGMSEWVQGGERRDSVIRLFYVGMTRAREKLTLCGSSSRSCVLW